ncbi:MAG: YceI family protein [Bacteroidota bacterium]|nr:YceI family protein [Bacteroidota bacterium]
MKSTLFLLSTLLVMASCDNAPQGDTAVITDEQQVASAAGATYVVDTTNSRIRFVGHGVGKNHPGTFQLSSGQVVVANNTVTEGEFNINIRSIDLEQKESMFQNKLKPHLLSGDFFDADNFSSARFEITNVQTYQPNSNDTSIVEGANFTISGNFTLRNTTKNISFPANIELDGSTLKAVGNFDIDRTQWQINYGNDKTLGDKFISEKVNIELDLRANKG